jgi:hypothetical protein
MRSDDLDRARSGGNQRLLEHLAKVPPTVHTAISEDGARVLLASIERDGWGRQRDSADRRRMRPPNVRREVAVGHLTSLVHDVHRVVTYSQHALAGERHEQRTG